MNGRVLVTGSSRGIGRAIAIRLAEDGWQVVVHYANSEIDAESVRRTLGDRCAGVYRADLSDPDQATKLFDDVSRETPLDALVNNAGIYIPVDFVRSGDGEFQANWKITMAVNLESPLRLMHGAAKLFASQGHGKIVNIASRAGIRGESGAVPYAASKAAILSLTRSLALELAPLHIGVFGVAPGWVETAMGREGMADRLPSILTTIPLGRVASPEDCAAVTAFLLREEASYLSGVVIDVNGASYLH